MPSPGGKALAVLDDQHDAFVAGQGLFDEGGAEKAFM